MCTSGTILACGPSDDAQVKLRWTCGLGRDTSTTISVDQSSGVEKNIFGSHLVSLPAVVSHAPPFASDPLMHIPGVEDKEETSANSVDFTRDPSYPSYSLRVGPSKNSEISIVEIDGPTSLGSQFVPDQDPKFMKTKSPTTPGTTTRKGTHHVDRQNPEISYYADDEDVTHKKYTRRGSFRHKFLRFLLPFWSSALPTLPVSAPPRKDGGNTEEIPEGRARRQRSSRMDPRKLLLTVAIMACLATMGILYYRLTQGSLGATMPEDEPQ